MKESLRAKKDKEEVIRQWSNDPCGMSGSDSKDFNSKEFYEGIDKNRYQEYGPWMKEALEFSSHGGKKILEIGFGMGTDLFQMAKAGAEVYGVDLSPKHLEITQTRFELHGMKANVQIADAEKLPFPDQSFDVVYTFGVLHHTPGTEKVVQEIQRVLRPNGRAIIAVYHRHSAFFYFCMLRPYILKFKFLNQSWRRAKAAIEYRENSDACPLVKLYSTRSLRKLCRVFKNVSIECWHLAAEHFGPFQNQIGTKLIKRTERKLGWYLIAKCTK